MSLGALIGKLITAPIKIAVMPIKAIGDAMESQDDIITAISESIESQVKDIVD